MKANDFKKVFEFRRYDERNNEAETYKLTFDSDDILRECSEQFDVHNLDGLDFIINTIRKSDFVRSNGRKFFRNKTYNVENYDSFSADECDDKRIEIYLDFELDDEWESICLVKDTKFSRL